MLEVVSARHALGVRRRLRHTWRRGRGLNLYANYRNASIGQRLSQPADFRIYVGERAPQAVRRHRLRPALATLEMNVHALDRPRSTIGPQVAEVALIGDGQGEV